MKIVLDDLSDEKILIEGCKACIKNPVYLANVDIHSNEYKKLLIKPRIAIIILFLSFFSANLAAYLTADDYSILYILTSILYFTFFSLPFSIRIKNVKKWYESTNELYKMMYNKKDLFIEFEDFKVNLFVGGNIAKSIYYYDLKNIEIRKNIIVFHSKKTKNCFFISSKYKEELMSILKAMELSSLLKEKEEWN